MLKPKLVSCMKDYTKDQFFKDLTSGIIVGIIALPLSIALAIASGVSPTAGLYTAIIGGLIVSLLGGSRVQIAGPTGAFVVIIYGIVQEYGLEGLVISTILAGIILILMGLLKLGNLVKFVPYPITTGFTNGIAIVIFSTQIKDFLGLSASNVPSEFIHKWIFYFKNLNTLNTSALLVGIISLLILILWPKINKKIPGTLIAIIVSTMIVLIFNLNVETIGSRFGTLSASIPSPHLPIISFSLVKKLILPALSIALLGAIESLLCAVVADGMIGGNHRSNMELIAQGTANIFSALFGGIPVTGAIARTAANIKNGGRTPIAGIVHAITLFIIMYIFIPYVKLIPMSALAAILILVAYNMGEWYAFKHIKTSPKSDSVVLLATFLLTVIFDLVIAILVGFILAAFLFMKRMIDVSNVSYKLDARECDNCASIIKDELILKRITIYEISGPFFFGAADKFIKVMKEIGVPCEVIILKMENVPALDITAYNALEQFRDMCFKNNRTIIISQLQDQPRKFLTKNGFIESIGKDNTCSSMNEAIHKAQSILKK